MNVLKSRGAVSGLLLAAVVGAGAIIGSAIAREPSMDKPANPHAMSPDMKSPDMKGDMKGGMMAPAIDPAITEKMMAAQAKMMKDGMAMQDTMVADLAKMMVMQAMAAHHCEAGMCTNDNCPLMVAHGAEGMKMIQAAQTMAADPAKAKMLQEQIAADPAAMKMLTMLCVTGDAMKSMMMPSMDKKMDGIKEGMKDGMKDGMKPEMSPGGSMQGGDMGKDMGGNKMK
jgi:hypothetical protein